MIANRFRFFWLLALVVALAWPVTPVWAQSSDMQILLDRLERLERDIRTLNRQIARTPQSASQAAPQMDEQPSVSSQAPSGLEFSPSEGAVSRLTVRLTALEGEVRQATGQAESLSYRLDQLTERLDTLVSGLNYRFQRLEGTTPAGTQPPLGALEPKRPGVMTAPSIGSVSKVGEMPPPTGETTSKERGTVDSHGVYTPPKSAINSLGNVSSNRLEQVMSSDGEGDEASAPTQHTSLSPPSTSAMPQASAPAAVAGASSVLPAGTPRERYQYAFGLMSQARYDEAEVALKEFIAQYGDDPLVGNARYWLGETYYVRKSFMDAAQAFFQAYKTAPDGAKAPDSLLKLGMSMASLDKTEEACATYGKLRKEFADLKPNLLKALNRETKRLKCE